MIFLRLLLFPLAAACASTMAEEVPLDSMLAIDDECLGGEGGRESCSLNALQLKKRLLSADRDTNQKKKLEESETEMSETAADLLRRGGWAVTSRCHGAELHVLDFFVPPSDESRIRDLAMDRTNPASPNYRNWLSQKEVRDLVRNDASLLALRTELTQHEGVEVLHESGGGDILKARAPVRTWESLLSTKFFTYQHPKSSYKLFRASSYELPEKLRAHVGGVLNVLEFPDIGRKDTGVPVVQALLQADKPDAPTALEAAQARKMRGMATPNKLRKMYNIRKFAERGSELAKHEANTSQVVYSFKEQHWSEADRTEFQAAYGIPQDSYVRQLRGHEVGLDMSNDVLCRKNPYTCSEGALDVEYVSAVSPWSQHGFWYDSPRGDSLPIVSFLTDFLDHLLDLDGVLPQVVTISYSAPEGALPQAPLDLFEVLAMKVTLLGVSIVSSSGDDGAASRGNEKDCRVTKEKGLMVGWPASSQWVTAVGATTGLASDEPEVACQTNATGIKRAWQLPSITSGGGYSKMVPRPAWQEADVTGKYRGVPDVSLHGSSYSIRVGGSWAAVDGTSASAPVLAGMISLINAELGAAGRPSVGLLNPLLYSKAAKDRGIFNDITKGDNRCASRGVPCCGGYDATEGWDPVTGLGSLRWDKLRDLVLATGK